MSPSIRPAARRPAFATFAVLCLRLLMDKEARAEEPSAPAVTLAPMVVSATRIPTPESQLASSVTVITAEEIEQKQRRTLPDVLQDVPGLNVVQTGSPGGTTSVFMRGTNANHTKVLIDGIDVSDPSSIDGSFDFSQVLASNIERIEVLRGPQSGLYGSDAIGGVINIITKAGSGPPQVHGSMEGGSFGTFNQTAGISGSQSRFNYVFDFAHFRTADARVTPVSLVPLGRPVNSDLYDNKTYATKLGANLTENFDVGLVTRYVETDLRATSDDLSGPEAVPSSNFNKELFTRGTAHLVLFDGTFEQTAGFGYTDYHRLLLDPNSTPASPSIFRGDRYKYDWQGNIRLVPGQILTIGAEHQLDEINDSSPVQAHMMNDAGFVQLQSSFGERWFNTASARYDANSRFGSEPTFRIAPAFLILETDTKLKASVGTGFKAPTLDQLFDNFPAFGFFGNPNLRPETSLGYDFGFEQAVLDKRMQFGATYFHNDIHDLITINNTGTSYANVGHATTYGAESFVAWRPCDPVRLRLDYTYTIARNDDLRQELLRRPKSKFSGNAAWQVTDHASISATVLYTGSRLDVDRDGAVSGLSTSSYTLVNLAGSYEIGHGVTAFARVDNLLDRRYQDPIGFQRPGLGVFGGLRVALEPLEALR